MSSYFPLFADLLIAGAFFVFGYLVGYERNQREAMADLAKRERERVEASK